MANYTVTGRDAGGLPVVSVTLASIDQEQQVVAEMTIVDAVRDCLAAVPGVQSVLARKYEQIITIV
ncbi:hypothetical protein ACH4ZX_03955 [Streptomyces sp. NPDC020490]|uniref:hypothetical protein n=1 Tax=Streptomyces sp. NPDC020490 TaxID=3365078 RepID=UPI00378F2BD6